MKKRVHQLIQTRVKVKGSCECCAVFNATRCHYTAREATDKKFPGWKFLLFILWKKHNTEFYFISSGLLLWLCREQYPTSDCFLSTSLIWRTIWKSWPSCGILDHSSYELASRISVIQIKHEHGLSFSTSKPLYVSPLSLSRCVLCFLHSSPGIESRCGTEKGEISCLAIQNEGGGSGGCRENVGTTLKFVWMPLSTIWCNVQFGT